MRFNRPHSSVVRTPSEAASLKSVDEENDGLLNPTVAVVTTPRLPRITAEAEEMNILVASRADGHDAPSPSVLRFRVTPVGRAGIFRAQLVPQGFLDFTSLSSSPLVPALCS